MTDPLFHPQLSGYLDSLVPARNSVLQSMEERAKETDFPIIGPASGQLCYQVARMVRARKVFEMGSGFGYSTAWFARAVAENGGGQVHHVVWDAELSRDASEYLGALGYEDIVSYTVGEAIETLRKTEGPFDLIFNDIEKQAYPESLEVIEQKLKHGGVLIVDNMLWSGRIFDESDSSPQTDGVREFTRRITTSAEWITSLVPIRDGVIVAYRM